MDLLSLALSLSLPMEGSRFTGDFTFDANPVFGIPFENGLPWRAGATTIPGAVLYDAQPYLQGTQWDIHANPDLLRHELGHVEQQAALGPAFWLGYALTGGRAFEPYDPLGRFVGLPSSDAGANHDMNDTWMPPEGMPRDYPLFRVEKQGDTTSFQLLPGFPGVTIHAP